MSETILLQLGGSAVYDMCGIIIFLTMIDCVITILILIEKTEVFSVRYQGSYSRQPRGMEYTDNYPIPNNDLLSFNSCNIT